MLVQHAVIEQYGGGFRETPRFVSVRAQFLQSGTEERKADGTSGDKRYTQNGI